MNGLEQGVVKYGILRLPGLETIMAQSLMKAFVSPIKAWVGGRFRKNV